MKSASARSASCAVAANLRVDVVLVRPPRVGEAQRDRILRGRAAVLVVEVPSAAHRIPALHEHTRFLAREPIKVLEQQPLAVSRVRPRAEIRF
jgi:hypothetical protein